jgi:hypothetical protein
VRRGRRCWPWHGPRGACKTSHAVGAACPGADRNTASGRLLISSIQRTSACSLKTRRVTRMAEPSFVLHSVTPVTGPENSAAPLPPIRPIIGMQPKVLWIHAPGARRPHQRGARAGSCARPCSYRICSAVDGVVREHDAHRLRFLPLQVGGCEGGAVQRCVSIRMASCHDLTPLFTLAARCHRGTAAASMVFRCSATTELSSFTASSPLGPVRRLLLPELAIARCFWRARQRSCGGGCMQDPIGI